MRLTNGIECASREQWCVCVCVCVSVCVHWMGGARESSSQMIRRNCFRRNDCCVRKVPRGCLGDRDWVGGGVPIYGPDFLPGRLLKEGRLEQTPADCPL